MIHCKKHFIAAGFALILPLTAWSEAPVVDDSENFAIIEGQQVAQAPAGNPKYDEPQIENGQIDGPQNNDYQANNDSSDDEPALVQEDSSNETNSTINDNAKLVDKIQNLQKEIQELRGQLEVQAHDLKLLQQQQVAYYKDLDARLGGTSNKSVSAKPALDLSSNSKTATTALSAPAATAPALNTVNTSKPAAVIAVSRVNPADEQISYLAAYELVKNKRYDNALQAMHTFVQKYPNGGYTANAEYWLGELYLVKKAYPKAIEHFEIVLNRFPSSSKAAASLLKAGYAYAATGKNQEAKKLLQQVVKTYPDTHTAQLAHSKLEVINAL